MRLLQASRRHHRLPQSLHWAQSVKHWICQIGRETLALGLLLGLQTSLLMMVGAWL